MASAEKGEPMLFDHREDILYSVNRLRDVLTLTIIRMSEDPRNETLCEKFRDIRDQEVSAACAEAHRGTQEALERAMTQAQTGLIRLLELHANIIHGKALSGEPLPPGQRLKMHGIITRADRPARKSGTSEAPGAGQKPDRQEAPVEIEGALIVSELGYLLPDIRAELKASGAAMDVFDRVYTGYHHSTPEQMEDKPDYVKRLVYVMSNTCRRLYPVPKNDSHPNMPVSDRLRVLASRLENASGDGFAAQILGMVDPAAALSAPPPPPPEQVMKRCDAIFKDLHQLLYSPAMEKAVPLRDTRQCRLSLQGSIRSIREALPRAVRDLESQGEAFPQYHAVADRGRGR